MVLNRKLLLCVICCFVYFYNSAQRINWGFNGGFSYKIISQNAFEITFERLSSYQIDIYDLSRDSFIVTYNDCGITRKFPVIPIAWNENRISLLGNCPFLSLEESHVLYMDWLSRVYGITSIDGRIYRRNVLTQLQKVLLKGYIDRIPNCDSIEIIYQPYYPFSENHAKRSPSTFGVLDYERHRLEKIIKRPGLQSNMLVSYSDSFLVNASHPKYKLELYPPAFENNTAGPTMDYIQYAFVDAQMHLPLGLQDADGDSLRVEYTCPISQKFDTNYVLHPPFDDCQNFFIDRHPFALDSSNGDIYLDSAVLRNLVPRPRIWNSIRAPLVPMIINEYSAQNKLKSKTLSYGIASLIEIPHSRIVLQDSMQNILPNMQLSKKNKALLCSADSFYFEVSASARGFGDSLEVSSNIFDFIPNAQLQPIYPLAPQRFDTLRIIVSGRLPQMANNFNNFWIKVKNFDCPFPTTATANFTLRAQNYTYISQSDAIICNGDSIPLSALGGSSFQWSVINGPPLSAANFSCDTCSTPFAKPTQTTTYQVVSNLNTNCSNANVDTIRIVVAPNFSFSTFPNDNVSCRKDNFKIWAAPINPNFSYQWRDRNFNLISNQAEAFIKLQQDTALYRIRVRSDLGCEKWDSLVLIGGPEFLGQPQLTVSDSIFCQGGTVNLGFQYKNPNPCETIDSICAIPQTSVVGNTHFIGNSDTVPIPGLPGNFNVTFYPSFVFNRFTRYSAQFLITTAELNAAGLVGERLISALNAEIINLNTLSQNFWTFDNYSIYLACTDSNDISTQLDSSAFLRVFDPKTINITNANNTFLFDRSFFWNGLSNLVIHVCYHSTFFNNPPHVRFTNTPYVSSIRKFSSVGTDCFSNMNQTFNRRPVFSFDHCAAPKRKDGYTFQWFPNTGIIGPDSLPSIAALLDTTNTHPSPFSYQLRVADSTGICRDTLYATLQILNSFDLKPIGDSLYCSTDSIIEFKSKVPGKGFWRGLGIADSLYGFWNTQLSDTGTFWVSYAVNDGNCAGVDSLQFSIRPPIVPTFNFPLEICRLDTLSLNASPAGGSWSGLGVDNDNQWLIPYNVLGDSSVVTYSLVQGACTTSAMDTVLFIEPFGSFIFPMYPICFADTVVQLKAAQAGGIWSGTGIVNADSGWFNPAIAGVGNHSITYEGGDSCTVPFSRIVVVRDGSKQQILPADTLFCEGDSVELKTNGFVANPLWSDSTEGNFIVIKQGGSFSYIGLNDFRCPVISDTVVVREKAIFPLQINGDTILCSSDTFDLSSNANFPVLWTPSPFQQSDNTAKFKLFQQQLILLNALSDTACAISDSLLVDVIPAPKAVFPNDTNLCLQANIYLAISNPDSSWSLRFETEAKAVDSNLFSASFFINKNQSIQMIVANTLGCDTAKVININLLQQDLPTDYTTNLSCEGVLFNLNETAEAIIINGDTLTEVQAFSLDKNQLAIVLKEVENCLFTDTLNTQNVVIGDDLLKMPNVFTPNNDGKNDFFEPDFLPDYSCAEMHIFNRWGQLIYHSPQGQSPTWNGTNFAGEPLSEGVYFWIMSINGFEAKGTVTLLR